MRILRQMRDELRELREGQQGLRGELHGLHGRLDGVETRLGAVETRLSSIERATASGFRQVTARLENLRDTSGERWRDSDRRLRALEAFARRSRS